MIAFAQMAKPALVAGSVLLLVAGCTAPAEDTAIPTGIAASMATFNRRRTLTLSPPTVCASRHFRNPSRHAPPQRSCRRADPPVDIPLILRKFHSEISLGATEMKNTDTAEALSKRAICHHPRQSRER